MRDRDLIHRLDEIVEHAARLAMPTVPPGRNRAWPIVIWAREAMHAQVVGYPATSGLTSDIGHSRIGDRVFATAADLADGDALDAASRAYDDLEKHIVKAATELAAAVKLAEEYLTKRGNSQLQQPRCSCQNGACQAVVENVGNDRLRRVEGQGPWLCQRCFRHQHKYGRPYPEIRVEGRMHAG